MIQPQLCYKSHRTYPTNHMGSISYHIMPLVINSVGADKHTYTHKHTYKPMSAQKQFKKPGACQLVAGVPALASIIDSPLYTYVHLTLTLFYMLLIRDPSFTCQIAFYPPPRKKHSNLPYTKPSQCPINIIMVMVNSQEYYNHHVKSELF